MCSHIFSPFSFAIPSFIPIFAPAEQKKVNMTTHVLDTASPLTVRLWGELQGISNNVKLELITLLSTSMTMPEEHSAAPVKGWASRFAGVWKDNRSAQEIIDNIRAARTTNTVDVAL